MKRATGSAKMVGNLKTSLQIDQDQHNKLSS